MAYTDAEMSALRDLRGKHCHSAQRRSVEKRLLSAKVRERLMKENDAHPSQLVQHGLQGMEYKELRSKDIRDVHHAVSRWRRSQQERRAKMAEKEVTLALQGQGDADVVAESVSLPEAETVASLTAEADHGDVTASKKSK